MKNKKNIAEPSLPIDSKWLVIGLVLIIIIAMKFAPNFFGLNIKPTPTPTPTPSVKKILPPEALPKQVYLDMAEADLANKLQIDKQTIKTVKAEARSWNDTSLGCPEKGKIYAQVITPGFVVELSANEKVYTYHAGLDRVVNCRGN
ncbi:hypothetical protein HZB96_02465 [Candidatus Gottesmanbacteria bacterium]|nr:hypothetical protein [Candidatus Gottesmanbacteria bacterium]MBI5452724.1 hypothetical protein [Candidatus Gottesmanbacteria bacterium]